jgi:transposase
VRVRNQYTDEFRTDAAKLALQGDRSLKQVAADLGVNHWTLREWVRSEQLGKRRKKASGKAAPANPATETPEQKLKRLERENQRLQKENDSLRMDREILKKAAAFFAKESE